MDEPRNIPPDELESFLVDLVKNQARIIVCIKAVKDKV